MPDAPSLPPFQRLLDRESQAVLGYLISLVGPGEADDCFQETFLAALRGYGKLTDGRNLRGWLFTIAHRKGLDALARSASGPRPGGSSEEIAEIADRIAAGARLNGGAGLPAGVSADDPPAALRGEVWEAVAGLPPKQRAVIALRFAADLTHREIGVAIECSEAAARRNLHEGLKTLREEFA